MSTPPHSVPGRPDVGFFLSCVSALEDLGAAHELFVKLWNREGTTAQAEQWLAQLKQIAPIFFRYHSGGYLELRVAARPAYDRVRAQMGDRLSKDQLIRLVAE